MLVFDGKWMEAETADPGGSRSSPRGRASSRFHRNWKQRPRDAATEFRWEGNRVHHEHSYMFEIDDNIIELSSSK